VEVAGAFSSVASTNDPIPAKPTAAAPATASTVATAPNPANPIVYLIVASLAPASTVASSNDPIPAKPTTTAASSKPSSSDSTQNETDPRR
jgi:hypothetical protein